MILLLYNAQSVDKLNIQYLLSIGVNQPLTHQSAVLICTKRENDMASAKRDSDSDTITKLGKLFLRLLDSPQIWRERMFTAVFGIALALETIPLISSLVSAFWGNTQRWPEAVFYSALYAALIFILLWRKGPLESRGRIGIVCIYSLGLLSLVLSGPNGNGRPYLFAAALVASLLLGTRTALWMLFLDILTLSGIGFLIVKEFPLWPVVDATTWIAETLALLMLATTIIMSVSILVSILEKSLAKAESSAKNLQKIVHEQEQIEKDLSHRLELDAIVIDLSYQLGNTSVENLDQTLESILENIGHALDAERAQLFSLSMHQKSLSITHEWCSPDFFPHYEFLQSIPFEWLPWLNTQLLEENHIVLMEPGEFAEDAASISGLLLSEGIHSSASICLSYQSQCMGLLVLDAARYPQDWDNHDLSMIQTVASLIAARQNQMISERAQSQSEYRYRRLVESTPLAIFILDRKGRIVDMNASAYLLDQPSGLDATQGLLAYKPFAEAGFGEKFALCIDSFKSETGELDYLNESGNRTWVRYHLAPIAELPENEEQILLIVEDISETKHLQDELSQAAKMEALGRLAGGVAHDFNNLLTVINGYSEMLKFDAVDERTRLDAETIWEAGQRAVGLTKQLLMFSRRQPLELVPLHVNQVLEEIAKMLRRLVNEDIELEIDLSNEVGLIEADRGQIEQVIMNLVVNARDAMPTGGHIRITTFMQDLNERVNAIPQADNGPHVCIRVSDNGSGIEPEVMERLFEPFYTTKDKEHGTGLGLATVYGITSAAGGHIAVSSKIGQGTTFDVFFPEKQTHATGQSAPDDKINRGIVVGGHEHILVIEDDFSVKRLVLRVLNELGYQTLSAASGSEGLALLRQAGQPVDMIISDVVMPGINGARLLNRIREIHPELPVLLISGYPDGVIDEHGELSTRERLLRKPVTREKLGQVVREMLDSI